MKKKILLVLAIMLILVGVVGCSKKEEKKGNDAALTFKEKYESLNGKTNASGAEHRTVSIPEDNPYVEITQDELIKLLDSKDTYYLYVGDEMCPWCRSAIEKSIEIAKEKGIDKIYYIQIWDDDVKEIFRDKYEITDDDKLERTVEPTAAYRKLLTKAYDYLDEYKLKKGALTFDTGERRVYAPNYFYFKDGEVVKKIEGTSELQEGARDDLTQEILDDEAKIFREFFTN